MLLYNQYNRRARMQIRSIRISAVKIVVNTKGIKGEISPELKEAILYLDHEEITGSYSEELDEAVQELKSGEK